MDWYTQVEKNWMHMEFWTISTPNGYYRNQIWPKWKKEKMFIHIAHCSRIGQVYIHQVSAGDHLHNFCCKQSHIGFHHICSVPLFNFQLRKFTQNVDSKFRKNREKLCFRLMVPIMKLTNGTIFHFIQLGLYRTIFRSL